MVTERLNNAFNFQSRELFLPLKLLLVLDVTSLQSPALRNIFRLVSFEDALKHF